MAAATTILPEAVQSAVECIQRLCSAPISQQDKNKFLDAKSNRDQITKFVTQFSVERYHFKAGQRKEELNDIETGLLYNELKAFVEYLSQEYITKALEIPDPLVAYCAERVKKGSHSAILGSSEIVATVIADPLPSHLRLRDTLYSSAISQSLKRLGADTLAIEGFFEDHKIDSPYKMLKTLRENEYQDNEATIASRQSIKNKYPLLDAKIDNVIRTASSQAGKRATQRARDACRTLADWKTFFQTHAIPLEELPKCVEKCLVCLEGPNLPPVDLKLVHDKVVSLFPPDDQCPNSALVRFRSAVVAAHTSHFTQIDERSSISSIRPYVRVTKNNGCKAMISATEQLKDAVISNPTNVPDHLLNQIETFKAQIADYGGRTARSLFSHLELAKYVATSADATTLVSRVEQRWPLGVDLKDQFGKVLRDFVTSRISQFDSAHMSAYLNATTREQKLSAYNGLQAHHAIRRLFSHIDAKLNAYAAEIEQMAALEAGAQGGGGVAENQQPQPLQDAEQNQAEGDAEVIEVVED